jgi:hypothetical protein
MAWVKEITATRSVLENQTNTVFYVDGSVLKAEIRIDSNDGSSETVILDIDNDQSLSVELKAAIASTLLGLKEEAMARLGYTEQV